MHILIAPDSFKGSLTALEICQTCTSAIHSIAPNTQITSFPLADGGEGTVDAFVHNAGGQKINLTVTGPLNKPVDAFYGILADNKTAIIEMASCAGLPLLTPEQQNPLYTTTKGVGELILNALDRQCNKIILGLGGSATHDGGAGALSALGYEFLDEHQQPIPAGAEGLLKLCSINTANLDPRVENTEFIIASDVKNPLLGEHGAASVFGPQKGATPEMIPTLDRAVNNLIQRLAQQFDMPAAEIIQQPGAGAAGGMGAGLLTSLSNASIHSGFEVIAQHLNLTDLFKHGDLDLVITAEGQINQQTSQGKLPVGVAKLASQYNIPVIALVGSIGKGAELTHEQGITSIFSIINQPMPLEHAVTHADELLHQTMREIFRLVRAFHTEKASGQKG
ncbi:glycerate kinase [Zooshikella marina]|uniref:glycerate kinase family protein n=1 Tax=Zooshikella ganghwensis TaxID=202772 RepID=UPI001BB0192B|nr:glycerate kinase [Zooshikella ganghwensis]MBU2704540.1 glycerate kinase [Zooshikella ganghwensis]